MDNIPVEKVYVSAPGGADTSIKFECLCHGGTALVIDGWKWEQSDNEYIFEVGHEIRPTSFKERLKAIWAFLRGRTYEFSGGVLSHEQMLTLRDWLNKEFQA